MAKQQFNRRLSDEAIAAINWWAKQDSTPARKVTDTEIVERAIAFYDGMRAAGGEVPEVKSPGVPDWTQGRNTIERAQMLIEQTGVPGEDRRPKNCRCSHCPEMFAGARHATICPQCKSTGHTLSPAECPQCTAGLAL